MTRAYRRKSIAVDVFHYTGQVQSDWPLWMQEYRGGSMFNGVSGISRTLVQDLIIPVDGEQINAKPFNWLVFDGRRITVVRNQAEFDLDYEEIPEVELAGVQDRIP